MAPHDTSTRPDDRVEPPESVPGGQRSALVLLLRVVAGLAVAASFGVWAYAYSGRADRPPPDLLIDTELAATAETLCAAAVADVEAMPSATVAADGAERAEQVLRSTARFQTLIADLEALRVDEPDDRVIMSGWLTDWRVLMDDRLRYAEAVTEEPDTIFLLTNVAAGERLDRRITRVANTNRMPSCATPTDVG